jgi:hypothetical protein
MITKEQFLSITRHFITAIGGILIARGVTSEELTTEIIGGLMTFAGALWGVLSKKK